MLHLTCSAKLSDLLKVYDQVVEAVLLELGLDARGVAASSGWRVDGTVLRSSIRRLRGICTHPQVWLHFLSTFLVFTQTRRLANSNVKGMVFINQAL